MSCCLRLSGEALDVDRAAALISAKPDVKSAVGATGRHGPGGYLAYCASHRDASDLPGQIEEVGAFLRAHFDELVVVLRDCGVEDARLDFMVELRVDHNEVLAQFDYFPPELVALAGELSLGLEVSLYPRSREPGE